LATGLKPGFHPNARNAIDCVRKVRKKRNKITQAKKHCVKPVSIQTQAPANSNGRSKQPIIEAANQTLALLAVFVYARNAIDCVAFGWKSGFSYENAFRLH